jgi:hypothetical protein
MVCNRNFVSDRFESTPYFVKIRFFLEDIMPKKPMNEPPVTIGAATAPTGQINATNESSSGSRPLMSIASMGAAASADAVPTALPPANIGTGGIGATTWHSDVRVTALWSINQNRNVWCGLSDVGWKPLANNSDSAIVALNILAANALQARGRVDAREESDGMIHELYVW